MSAVRKVYYMYTTSFEENLLHAVSKNIAYKQYFLLTIEVFSSKLVVYIQYTAIS